MTEDEPTGSGARIGDPLAICRDCSPAHYDNCPTCFGYGVRPRTEDGDPVPVPGHLAGDETFTDWLPCPTCKSTLMGVPT